MILRNDFFQVLSQQESDGKAIFRIKLNAEHFIYQAHFPNYPITPGACLIQIAQELFCLLKGENFNIKTLKNVKFINIINPLEFPEVDILLEHAESENLWQLKVWIQEKETVFSKMSLVLFNSRQAS